MLINHRSPSDAARNGRTALYKSSFTRAASSININPTAEKPRTDGKKILERISKETGGRFFEVSKKESVGEIYTSIVEELRTQYRMGFTPDKDSAANGYHHLQLQVKLKDTTVQTREGYYSGQ